MVSAVLKGTIIFVRHGNTFERNEQPRFVGSREDPPLTEKGRRQLEAVGSFVRDSELKPRLVYSGPRLRQKESAEIICRIINQGITATVDPLLEEIDYGLWEGLTQSEIASRWPVEYKAWQESDIWPESIFGVSKKEFKNKIESWLNTARATDKNIVVVTSNGVLRMVHEIIKAGKISPSSKVKPGNICAISFLNGASEVLYWNREPVS